MKPAYNANILKKMRTQHSYYRQNAFRNAFMDEFGMVEAFATFSLWMNTIATVARDIPQPYYSACVLICTISMIAVKPMNIPRL